MIRLFAVLTFFAAILTAQDGLVLRGVVKDAQGKVVAGAQVRLFRQDAEAPLRTSTGSRGDYAFDRLAPGSFFLEIEKEGFQTFTRSIAVAGAGGVPAVDVVLSVAGVNQSVVVTAARVPQTLDETSKALSIITSDEIEAKEQFSLMETLRNTAGVLITNGGGPGQNSTIRIRGLPADATGVLVDGMRFRDPAAPQGDSSSFISALNIVNPDRIEVLRGSGSSLYGTDAVGGVVNVVTNQGGGPLQGQLLAEGGNLGTFRTRATVSGGALDGRLSYSAGVMHLNVMSGVDGDDTNRSTGGQGFVRYDFTPKLNLTGRLWVSDDFAKLNNSPGTSGIPLANIPAAGVIQAIPLSPAGVAIINAGGTPAYGNATFVPDTNDTDYRRASRFVTTAVTLRDALTPRVSWEISYQHVYTGRVYENGPAGGGFQPVASNYSRYLGQTDIVNAHIAGQVATWMNLIGGYEFERESYFDTQNNNLPLPKLILERTNIAQKSNAGYFASQLSFLQKRLQISFSGRAQIFALSTPGFQITGASNNYARTLLMAPPKALTGDISAAYFLARSSTKLRTHFGNAYRAPALFERFGAGFSNNPTTGQTTFTPYGDPRLGPDRYNSLDAGIDQYLFGSRVRVSATMFYTRIVSLVGFDFSGAIKAATDPYGRFAGYLNGSGGISRGAEFAIETRPMKSLTVSGSYTHVNAGTDRDSIVPGFFKSFGQPANTATVVATNHWSRRFETTFDLFCGSSYDFTFFAISGSRAYQFPGFTKADIVASYRFWESEKRFARVYGKVDNIFNQRVYQNGWLNPQATFVMGVGYGY